MLKYLCQRIIVAISGLNVVLYNICNTKYKKNALLVYILDPYIYDYKSNVHQAFEQVKVIAKTISECGYNVDLIDYRASKIKLNKCYDAVFDVRMKNNPIYINYIGENTKRIVYFTESEASFANSAELERIEDVKRRRGAELKPRRQVPMVDPIVEKSDLAIMIGSKYNFDTYNKFYFKKSAIVPNTGYNFNFVFDKNYKKSTSYIFFGSAGSVHKGLDLLLEVFSELGSPYKLYVCGYFEREEDFVEEYYDELFNTPNIIPIGFLDIMSDRFRELSNECAFTLLPSCSEGCAGSIVTCMSAGIIPICSRNCGYDDNEVITLADCKKETIKQAIIDASNMSMKDIENKSIEVVELTKTKYCIENYKSLMHDALKAVLK
jgi:hypothetical protein